MPDVQLTNELSPRDMMRSHCPMCEAKMEVLHVVPGRPGFEHRTLRCTTCGTIYEAQASADPINSEATGWLHIGLNPVSGPWAVRPVATQPLASRHPPCAARDDQSPAQLAKANRLRLARAEGERALQEAEARAVAVRANMERLRALRLAQEAQAVRTEIAAQNQATKPKPKKRSR